jgi:hypothetical protein
MSGVKNYIHLEGEYQVASPIEVAAEFKKFWSQVNVHDYWFPNAWKRTDRLIDLFDRMRIPKNARICEFGCGCLRNLVGLHYAGYKSLCGYDITDGQQVLKIHHNWEISIGGEIPRCDVMFSIGSLQHVIPDDMRGTMDRIIATGTQILFTCETTKPIDENLHFEYVYNYQSFLDGWGPVLCLPANESDGLDHTYLWQAFYKG